MPDYRVILCDLTQYSDEEIKAEVLSRVVFLVFKHLYTGELKKRLPSILALLEELQDKQTGLEYLSVLLRYLSEQKVVPISAEELKAAVEEALPKGEEIMLSLAEKWKDEGRQEGIQEGERSTLRRMFLRLLERRFGAVPVDLMLTSEKLVATQLNRLFDLAVDAASLDEVEQAMGQAITV